MGRDMGGTWEFSCAGSHHRKGDGVQPGENGSPGQLDVSSKAVLGKVGPELDPLIMGVP